MTQTTIPTAPGQDDPMHTGASDVHLPPQPGDEASSDESNPVWATPSWNPVTNEWAPSNEQPDVWGVAEPSHGDVATAEPLTEQYGHDPSGTTPHDRLNLLDSVRPSRTPVPAPQVTMHHVVETVEQGSPIWQVRQVSVQGNVTPTQLVEENNNRKRVLIRVLPSDSAASTQNNNLTATGVPATVTVPAGKTWTLQDVAFLYTASAAVGNRTPQVTIKDAAGRVLFLWSSPLNIAASQVAQISLTPGAQSLTGGGGTAPNPFTINGPLPAITLQPGSTITASALSEDVADTITVGTVMFAQASVGGGASIFVSPRYGMSGVVAPSAWWKVAAGDPPLEIKVGYGIDAICGNAGDTSQVQVLEEMEKVTAGTLAPATVT